MPMEVMVAMKGVPEEVMEKRDYGERGMSLWVGIEMDRGSGDE